MFNIDPFIPEELNHQIDLWTKSECYRFYVQERRLNCNFMQVMNLWLRAPFCESCALTDPFERYHQPDIFPNDWQSDIEWTLGEEVLESVDKLLQDDADFAFVCKGCNALLQPWNGDRIHVVSYHMEEHFSIPLQVGNRKQPSKNLSNQIKKLYDSRCFSCDTETDALHIDHIYPQSKGGDAAFRNLQPLCKKCGNLKGNNLPEEIDVYSDIYFGPYPSDGYDGLFWSIS